MKYHLNLSQHPFPHYRVTNFILTGVLLLTAAFSLWQLVSFIGYIEDVQELTAVEQEVRVQWASLGDQIEDLDGRLRRPEALAESEEVRFLNTIIERRRFSWSLLLADIERIIPRDVYLTTLQPQIAESEAVLVRMEAIGMTIDSLSQFIRELEGTDTFRDVAVSSEAHRGIDGGSEIQLSMTAWYLPGQAVAP